MVQKFTGFITADGSKFECEKDAHRHEIEKAIRSKFPNMLSAVNTIMENVEWFALLLSPMAPVPKNHPAHTARPPLAGTTLPDRCQHHATSQTGNRKVCIDCGIVLPDPCPKGGDHNWVSKHNGLVDECDKCLEGRA